MKIRLLLELFGVGLVFAGLVWLFCRASVELGGERIRALLKDPPFALIIAGGLLWIAIGLFRGLSWLLTRIP